MGVNGMESQAPIPILEIPEIRPRKPSAKVSKIWKCGHAVDIDWVIDGFRYCPYCGQTLDNFENSRPIDIECQEDDKNVDHSSGESPQN